MISGDAGAIEGVTRGSGARAIDVVLQGLSMSSAGRSRAQAFSREARQHDRPWAAGPPCRMKMGYPGHAERSMC